MILLWAVHQPIRSMVRGATIVFLAAAGTINSLEAMEVTFVLEARTMIRSSPVKAKTNKLNFFALYLQIMSIQNAYNQWSEIYDSNENLTRDLDQILTHKAFSGKNFNSILELGCGTGKNTAFLVGIAEKVHALDFSEGMIAKAREKVHAANVKFSAADLTHRWPCEDEAYDLITCNLVLEHIQDLSHIFSEAARTLQMNGQFFINELHPFKQYRGTKA